MSDDNRIKGPGYYPRRPGKPVAPPEVKAEAAPTPPSPSRDLLYSYHYGSSFDVENYRTAVNAYAHAPAPPPVPRVTPAPTPPPVRTNTTGTPAPWTTRPARQNNDRYGLSYYSTWSSWDDDEWFSTRERYRNIFRATPIRTSSGVSVSARTSPTPEWPRHNTSSAPAEHCAYWCFQQHATPRLAPEYNRGRGISATILVEAPSRISAEHILERAGVRFDGDRWRRDWASVAGTVRGSYPEGTFVHRFDGRIEEITSRVARESDDEPNR